MIRGEKGEFWIKFPAVDDKPRFKLYYFPFSGGGATTGNRFSNHLPGKTEVIAFNAPSKQPRGGERFPDYQTFIDAIFPELLNDLNAADCPYALFGHSFGSLVAYLVLIKLRQCGARMPVRIFLASKSAPQLHEVNGDAFFRESTYAQQRTHYLENHGPSLPARFREDEELLKMVVTAFVVDMRVNRSFWMDKLTEEERQPFDNTPCTLFWGKEDKVVTFDKMAPWEQLFPQSVWVKFDGIGHMLVAPHERQEEIMRDIASSINIF
jgi:medium-chain acyl-[acyl-carrier-protein] hydrolase